MQTRNITNKNAVYIMVISIFLFIISFVFEFPNEFGLCNGWHRGCNSFYKDNFILLIWVGIISPIFFLIGLMSWVKNKSEKVFTAWWKFARIYLPIAFLLVAISPETGGGLIIGMGGGFDREGTVWFTSGLFFLTTFIMLPLKFWKYRPVKERQILGISRAHKDVQDK